MDIPATLTKPGLDNLDLDTLTSVSLRKPSGRSSPAEMIEANTRALITAC